MRAGSKFNRAVAFTVAFAIIFGLFSLPGGYVNVLGAENKAVDEVRDAIYKQYVDDIGSWLDYDRYIDYIEKNKGKHSNSQAVIIPANTYTDWYSSDPNLTSSVESYVSQIRDTTAVVDMSAFQSDDVYTDEEGYITYDVEVPEEGMYEITLEYYPIVGKSADIQRGIFINGELLYSEAGTIEFSRVWVNEKEIITDKRGNDLRPRQIEGPDWRQQTVYDSFGYYNEPLLFYLPKGTSQITLVATREPMVLRQITLSPKTLIPSYAEYHKNAVENQNAVPATSSELPVKVQAEEAVRKSSPMLYPVADNSTPAITPYSTKSIKMNTEGGYNWRFNGMWIEWEIDVPETGFYNLSYNIKQDLIRGTYVSRRLVIDDAVPFAEVNEIHYKYSNDYRVEVVGNAETKEPYEFYLTAGKHLLRLDVIMGDIADFYRRVENSVRNLNTIYRDVLTITGYSPDANRDYQIEKKFPELRGRLIAEKFDIESVIEDMEKSTGIKGDREVPLKSMVIMLDKLIKDVDRFPANQGEFKILTTGLGTWLTEIREMPLQIDEIYLLAPSAKKPKTNNSFLAKVWHEVSSLFYSFIIDYNAIGDVSTDSSIKTIKVWIDGGRDQANSLKSLINESFTLEHNIQVNLMLVNMGTLLPATLSGQGPDVAMQVANDLPMNYAFRGAVANLSNYDGFDEVANQFLPSALIPFQYEDQCYALPETQTYNMLFYRKDILKELGLEVPQTWDDVVASLSNLNKSYMYFGLGSTTTLITTADVVFAMFLYQNGGQLFNDEKTKTMIDSDEGIAAFKIWTGFYTDYKLEKEYDFLNRFRTGETPIGISDYTFYNQLQVTAPEIRGLWGFALIPGTLQSDGTINRSTTSSGSAVVIMNNSKRKSDSWEYLKWWTSAEVQVKFGRELEGLMGPAARYPTANIEALSLLPWPVLDYKLLKEQSDEVIGVPRVPGGYFAPRYISNAFYRTVKDGAEKDPRESLTYYVRYINDEITSKRKEFGLDK